MQTEEAYAAIADAILEVANESRWECAGVDTKVFSRMTESSYWRRSDGEHLENERFPSLKSAGPASKAVLFLRDDLLHKTGQRIWGLTFTLYPDGKFNIEYDYNKPEGYEETDEVVTGDEINASLNSLAGRDRPPS